MTNATGYLAQRTDSVYGRYRYTVITRYENRGTTPLYLGRCFPETPQPLFSVDLSDRSQGESAYTQIWACVGHNKQFQIVPGAVRIDTLVVEGPNTYQGGTTIGYGKVRGTYRVRFLVRTSAGDGAPDANQALGLSNPFIVTTDK